MLDPGGKTAWTFALVALSAASAGCSGTSTGTGTSGSSGGKSGGLFSGLKNSGGTGTSGSGSGGTSGGTAACMAEADDDACTTCIKGPCCTQFSACANHQACATLADCARQCTSDACISTCLDESPDGRPGVEALVRCGQSSCPSQCEIAGGTSSSGG